MSDQQLVQITRRKKFAEDEFWTMMSALYEQQWEKFAPPQLPMEDLPHKRAANFVTPPNTPVPDCLTCGVCCRFIFVVGLNSTDSPPAENIWDVTQKVKEREIIIDRFLKRDEETLHCAALDATTVSGRATCQIYERRPRPCHNFDAGSDKCHGLRRLFGLEAQLDPMEMFSAVQIIEAKAALPVATEKIRRVKIVETTETDELLIVAVMQDGSHHTVHSFDPNRESWLQFEFAGLTLAAARDVIDSRNRAGNFNQILNI